MNDTQESSSAVLINKKFWQSKTFWVNLLSIGGLIVQSKTGFVVDPAAQAIALGIVNGVLRTTTHSPISW